MKGERFGKRGYALFAALVAIASHATAAITIQQAQSATATYSPDADTTVAHNIRIRYNGTNPTSYCAVLTQTALSNPATRPSNADPLSYEIWNATSAPSQQLAIAAALQSSTQVLTGSFTGTKNATTTFNLNTIVRAASLPWAGTYTATIRVDLYASAYPPSGAIQNTATFTVTVTVGTHLDLSLVGDSTFNLASTSSAFAFGPIFENTPTPTVNLIARTNGYYKIQATSANGGAMINTIDSYPLAYYFYVSGTPAAFTYSGPNIASTVDVTSSRESPTYSLLRSYPLYAVVPSYADLPSDGDYADTLTISMISVP